MRISHQSTDEAVLADLGQRLERQRIEAGLTQAQLAQEAGIAKRTLERIESGAGCELITLVRILRVLKLTDGLNTLIPELPASPIALLKLKGRQRQRVSSPRQRAPKTSTRTLAAKPVKQTASSGSKWKWGE